MKVTLELSDDNIKIAVTEYMQRRYPNANRYGVEFFRWQPRSRVWAKIRQGMKVTWEHHVG